MSLKIPSPLAGEDDGKKYRVINELFLTQEETRKKARPFKKRPGFDCLAPQHG